MPRLMLSLVPISIRQLIFHYSRIIIRNVYSSIWIFYHSYCKQQLLVIRAKENSHIWKLVTSIILLHRCTFVRNTYNFHQSPSQYNKEINSLRHKKRLIFNVREKRVKLAFVVDDRSNVDLFLNGFCYVTRSSLCAVPEFLTFSTSFW